MSEPTYLSSEPRIAVSMGRKVQTGGYESVDIFMAVSGLEPGASEAEIEEAMLTGDKALAVLRKHMNVKIAAARSGKLVD